ncbi:MAG: hypothetical protein ABIT08_07245 [Bacteroidia bacterium]
MKDTPEFMRKRQIEIFNSLPEEVRFFRALQRMEDGKNLLESGIRNEIPGISDADLKIEVFRRMYHNDFSEEEMSVIFESFRAYHSNDKNQNPKS